MVDEQRSEAMHRAPQDDRRLHRLHGPEQSVVDALFGCCYETVKDLHPVHLFEGMVHRVELGLRHHHHAVLLGIFKTELDVAPTHASNALNRIARVTQSDPDALGERHERALAHREEELFLVFEVEIDGWRSDTDRVRDVAHGHRSFIAPLEEKLLGGIDDLFTELLAVTAPGPRPALLGLCDFYATPSGVGSGLGPADSLIPTLS